MRYIVILAILGLPACATKGFVRTQVDLAVKAEQSQRVVEDSLLRIEHQTDVQKTTEVLTTTNDKLNGLGQRTDKLEKMVLDLEQQITSLSDSIVLRRILTDGGVKFNTPIHFDFDSSVVKPEHHELLNKFVEIINNKYPESTLIVEGHTDTIGSSAYNLKLSQRRADAVAKYLVDSGLTNVKVISVGKGETIQIVGSSKKDSTTYLNRRITFLLEVNK